MSPKGLMDLQKHLANDCLHAMEGKYTEESNMTEDNKTRPYVLSSFFYLPDLLTDSWRGGPFRQGTPLTVATGLSSWPTHSPDLALYAFLSQPYLAKQPHISNLIFSPHLGNTSYASPSLITF